MTLEEQLINQLTSDADLSALVGNRIYPILLPENPKLPAITFKGVSEQNFYTLNGPQPNSDVTMEFVSLSLDYYKAKAVAKSLKKSLHALPDTLDIVEDVQITGTPDEYYPDVKFYQSGLRAVISVAE